MPGVAAHRPSVGRKSGYRAHQHCELPASPCCRPSDIKCRLPGLAAHRHSMCRLPGYVSHYHCEFPACHVEGLRTSSAHCPDLQRIDFWYAGCPRMLHISIASCRKGNIEGRRTSGAGCPVCSASAFGMPPGLPLVIISLRLQPCMVFRP